MIFAFLNYCAYLCIVKIQRNTITIFFYGDDYTQEQ